jgi:hypothetical protein
MVLKRATAKLRAAGIEDLVVKKSGHGKSALFTAHNPSWARQKSIWYRTADEAVAAALDGKRPTWLEPKAPVSRERANSFSGEGAYEVARKKARYGHCDWVVWQGKDGITQARRVTNPQVIKECLLATGTQGRWSLILASCAWSQVGTWRIGLNILGQFKCGMREFGR